MNEWSDKWTVTESREKWYEDARGLLERGWTPAKWVLDDNGEPRTFSKQEAEAFVAAGKLGCKLEMRRHPYGPYDRAPTFDSVMWHFDPALSGPRRRAFVLSSQRPRVPIVLVAYEDGCWDVEGTDCGAQGRAPDLASAKRRAFEVFVALTGSAVG